MKICNLYKLHLIELFKVRMAEPCPAPQEPLDYRSLYPSLLLDPRVPLMMASQCYSSDDFNPHNTLWGRVVPPLDDPMIMVGDIIQELRATDKPKIVDVEKELMKGATKEDERTQRMRTRLRNKIRRSSRKTGSK